MASFLPVTLVGVNLGQRHQHLNSLVHEAKERGASVQEVEALPEETAVDRLFKIDFAIELKHVDYIIRNLKCDDMLYVSRALKATWLINHHDIINPKYLEDVLFLEMITPAVTKMKHWLYINLRDPAMCQEFYQHYKENTFKFAIKFLYHCSYEFILEEAPKILTKLSTHSLKVLSEKCSKVAKIYFDSLGTDEDLNTCYLKRDWSYYNSVKCVLKSDADVFLDITEKYFNMENFSRLSSSATDYILRCHKTRFTNKLELYVAYFLHIPTVAARLSVEECQEVVIKLALASYLQNWFEYKVVEPLIKRLAPDKRAALKKRVFVDMDIGVCEDKWPYEIPAPPVHSDILVGPHIFDDLGFMSDDYQPQVPSGCGLFADTENLGIARHPAFNCTNRPMTMILMKTDLEKLFDEFRFIGFERALHELGQRLNATASPDRRRDIFIVLVSKTGGRTDAVAALLRLTAQFINETPQIRAAILRSLVKRAKVWRLSADDWQHLLDFGHGLGLDGTKAEAACREGLHAVIIRQLLAGECEETVRNAFMNDVSTLYALAQYSLTADERMRVFDGLQNMLIQAAKEIEPAVAAKRLDQLLDVLKIYCVRVEPTSPAVKAVIALASRDADVARPLLERLYNERIARRELLRHNMEFRRDQAALLNALRHDPSVLESILNSYLSNPADHPMDFVSSAPQPKGFTRNSSNPKRLLNCNARQTTFDSFISKLVIYFDQKHDFTTHLRTAVKKKLIQEQNVELARPLASLFGNDFEKELRDLDAAGKARAKLAAALRACAHRARPVVNLAEWGWRKAGVKAVATRAMRCREIERAALISALAAERRTVRVSIALSLRSTGPRLLLLETFASAAKLRPVVALHTALPYFRHHGAATDHRVWDIVKPLFSSVDLAPRVRLRQLLKSVNWIPSTIKPDYCITLYFALYKISRRDAQSVLPDLSKIVLECDESIETILCQMLDEDTDKDITAIPDPSIYIKYLLLSRNEEDVERRFMKIGNKFLEHLTKLSKNHNDSDLWIRIAPILKCLQYHSAFLDSKYTACLSVIERIYACVQKFLPKEKYFNNYTQGRLTTLYFKAVRQSIKQMPEVFADPRRRKLEGVEAVGFAFGRYIAKELAEHVNTYFDSIIELYTDGLIKYLSCNFVCGSSRNVFFGFMLKGILTEAVGIQRRVVVYILIEQYMVSIENSVRKEIEELIMKDRALEFFAHAELFSQVSPVFLY